MFPPPEYIPPLVFSFKKKGRARMHDTPPDAETADLEFREKRPDVLRRDKYACACCGIIAKDGKESGGGLEVHHLSGDHHDNRFENLITVCQICHAVLHFWFSATPNRHYSHPNIRKSMRIVHLPWISQEDLNLLSWAMAIVRYRCERIPCEQGKPDMDARALEIGESAGMLADAVMDCGKIPGSFFPGENGSCKAEAVKALGNAANLAMALREIARGHPDAFTERDGFLQGLRVFFDPAHLTDYAVKYSAMPSWLPGPGSKWAELWQAASDGGRA